MTIAEIAEAALPGLPASPRGVARRVTAEGWAKRPNKSRPRKGKGGGLEFSIELFPEAARAELLRRLAEPGEAVAGIQLRADDPLSGAERERRDARLHVLAMFDEFRCANGLTVRDARKVFPDAWNSGVLTAPDWVQQQICGLSKNTIARWLATRRGHGDDALGIDRRGRPAIIETAASGAVQTGMMAAIARQSFLSAPQLTDYLRDRFAENLPAVSERTIQRTRAKLEVTHRNVLMAIRNPDAYRSTVELAATNSTFSAGLNDLWQIDASPADVMLRGKKRHSVYVAIDIWSRRMKILVTQSPRAAAVGMLLRKCILDWGVPRRVKTDNGSDFKAKATLRLLTALEIEHELSAAYDPKSKGNVERAIGTFQRDLATCPGFIGHSVADRKVIESRKAFAKRLGMKDEQLFDVQMDLPEFQAWCDTWTGTIYAHRNHAGLRNVSPFLRAASWTGDIHRIAVPQALDVLLAPIAGKDGVRRVTKQGVKIEREYYQTSAAWPGEDVLVRMDPTDLGRAMIFALDGETYLGEAICAPLAGMDPVEVTMKVKAAQKAHMQRETGVIRAEMRKIGPRDFSDAMQREAEKKAGKLVHLERPATPYTTPALEAAQASIKGRDMPVQDYSPDEAKRTLAEVVKIPAPRREAQAASEKRDFRYAKDLEDELRAGRQISRADAEWLRGYQSHPDYTGAMRIYERLGRAMFG